MGETTKDFKKYKTIVQAHVLSITGKDAEEIKNKKDALGPALYKNLLNLGNSVSTLMEQREPAEYVGDAGWEKLLAYLEAERFHEGKLAELPRVYDKFYKTVVFRRGPREPMQAYISEKSLARHELQTVDSSCRVSDNELAY